MKGFTLIELLVVVAVIAVLATIVILTLNPAELIRQARDSKRVSDLNVLHNALGIYLADVTSIDLGVSGRCYQSIAVATTGCTVFFPTAGSTVSTSSRKIDSTGWVPVNFNLIGSGAPIGALPVDPINSDTYFYAYISSSTAKTFKLATRIESNKFGNGGSGDLSSKDGGSSSLYYETGTDLGM